MRQLERERRGVWFARYEDRTPLHDEDGMLTGEYLLTYGKPFMLPCTVSPRKGNTWGDGFGIGVDLDRTAVIDRIGTGVDETCIAWVDVRPSLDGNGETVVDEDGLMAVPNDYRVVMSGESFNYTSIALKKVK